MNFGWKGDRLEEHCGIAGRHTHRGCGAARTIASLAPGLPVILKWDWTPPLTAVLIPGEKRVAMKNLHVIDAVSAPAAVVRFEAPSGGETGPFAWCRMGLRRRR